MSFIYSVRCNFARPEIEDDWNRWYSGPKLERMLSKPLFRTGQRFAARGLNEARRYLAIWHVDSPEAFNTPEYKSDWGFFEWAPHIIDWSRDLYRLEGVEGVAIGREEALYLVSFENLSIEDARRELETIREERPGVIWMEAAGLDRHSPLLGLQRVEKGWRPQPLPPGRFQETIFEPITDCVRAGSLQETR